MSEYQYYEFVAIDRPLTRAEMAELRSCSSRATITATSFVNEYNWGDLKADPADWMRRYFDAFVYTANWCSCQFSLRLPREAFAKAELNRFATDCSLTFEDSGTHWIIQWALNESEDYERFVMEEGAGWMGRLAPLRDELLRGDWRPLYLGWLAGVSAGAVDEESMALPAPPGLANLSAGQLALAEFLEIDPDLLVAAAESGPKDADPDNDCVEMWLAHLPVHEMREFLAMMLKGHSRKAERQLKARFDAWTKESGISIESDKQHTVADLWERAAEAEQLRREREAKETAKREAERRKLREAYLRTIGADFDGYWLRVHAHIERRTAGGYEDAVRMLADLADAYALAANTPVFEQKLRQLMEQYGRRNALLRRLVEAGLWQGE